LTGFFSTTGVSSSSEDSFLATFLVTFFSSTFSFLVGLAAMMGIELSESSSESFVKKAVPQ
jgi:hypothetical protein